MDLSWHLPYGFSSAFTVAMEMEIDMKHNTSPVITCEGTCSKARQTLWQRHTFVSEVRVKPHEFEQIYHCNRCGAARRFGLTEVRITEKGESN